MKRIFLAASLIIAAASFTATITPASAASFAMMKKGDGQHIPASAVPAPVMASFNAQFPTAINAQWEKEKEHGQTVYQVDFRMNGKKWRAVYAADGTLISAGPR